MLKTYWFADNHFSASNRRNLSRRRVHRTSQAEKPQLGNTCLPMSASASIYCEASASASASAKATVMQNKLFGDICKLVWVEVGKLEAFPPPSKSLRAAAVFASRWTC